MTLGSGHLRPSRISPPRIPMSRKMIHICRVGKCARLGRVPRVLVLILPPRENPMILVAHVALSSCILQGGIFFFTVTLANRSSDLFVRHIDLFRRLYICPRTHPFETVAVCILPDHLHAIWSLPPQDADYTSPAGI